MGIHCTKYCDMKFQAVKDLALRSQEAVPVAAKYPANSYLCMYLDASGDLAPVANCFNSAGPIREPLISTAIRDSNAG